VLETFAKIDDRALRGMIVWVPMVRGDSALEAEGLVSPEKRFIMQAWDSRRSVGEALAKTLSLNCPAWDVYLVYPPGSRWDTDTAPMPAVWMHQLDSYSAADPKLHLDPTKFEAEVRRALAAAK
jgi:hypothetical protein